MQNIKLKIQKPHPQITRQCFSIALKQKKVTQGQPQTSISCKMFNMFLSF